MKYSNKPFYQKGGVKYLSGIASKINNKQQLTEQERNDYSDNYHKLASKGVDANGEEYLNANLPEVEVTAKRIPYTQGLPTPYKLMSGYADMAGQVMNTPAAAMGELAHAVSGKEANLSRIIPQQLNPYSKHWQGDKGTPEQRSVSDAANIQNPVGRFAVDLLTDPTTWTGAGVVKNLNKTFLKNIKTSNQSNKLNNHFKNDYSNQLYNDLNNMFYKEEKYLNTTKKTEEKELSDAMNQFLKQNSKTIKPTEPSNFIQNVELAEKYRPIASRYIDLVNSEKSLNRAKQLDKEHGTRFSKIIPEWTKNLKSNDKIDKAYNIEKFNNKDFIKYADADGFSSYKNDKLFLGNAETLGVKNGYLKPQERIVKINHLKNNSENIIPHELKHDLTHGDMFLTESYTDSQKKFLKPKEDFEKVANRVNPHATYEYFSTPTEIDAYLSTDLRRSLVNDKILKDPFDFLGEESLNNYLNKQRPLDKERGLTEALKVIGDKPEQRKAFVDWFNKALPAAGTGVIANEALKDKKQNGGIMNHKIYNNGGVIHLPKKNKGGMVDPVSTMGYKDNSPYANAKQLPIYSSSGAITMNGVSKPLMVKDVDNNEVRYLKPNSGVHQFKGQNFIEKPIFADGGTPQPITNYARGYANEGSPYEHYYYGNEGESVNNQGNERGKGYRTSNRNVARQMQQDMKDYALATGNKEMLREISGVDGAYGVKTANSFKKYGHNMMKWKADNGKLTPQQQKAWEAHQSSSKAPETKSGDNPAANANGNPNGSSSGANNKYGATTEPNLYGLQYNNPNNNQPYIFEKKPMFRGNQNTNATYNSHGYFSDTKPQSEANDNAPMSNKERLQAARKERRGQIGTNVSNWIDDWRGRRADKIEIRNAMRRDKEENREGYRDAQADSNRAITTADSDYRVQKHDYKTRGRLNKLDDETQAKLDRMTDKQNRLVVEKDAQSGRERRDYSYKPVAGSSENYAAENINNGQNQTFDNIQNKPVYTPQPIVDKVNYTDRQIQPMRRVDSLPAEEQPVVEKAPAKRVDNLVENMNQPQPKSYDINESMNQMLYPKKFNGGKVKSMQVYRVGGSMVKKYDDGGNTPNYVQQMNLPEPKKFNINDMMNQTLYPAKPQPNFQQPQTEQGYYRVGDVGGARMQADDMDTVDNVYNSLGTATANPNYQQTPATNSIGSSSGANTSKSTLKGEGRSPLHYGELMQLAGSAIAPLYDLGRSFAKPVHEKAINNEYRYQALDAQRKQRYNPNYKPIIANMAATQNNIRENSSNSQVARANQIAAMNAGNEMLSQEANKELMANQELANRYNTLKMGIGDAEAAEQKRIYENNMQHDALRENMRHNVATQIGALAVDAGKRRTIDAMNQLDYSMLNTIYNNYGTAAYSAVKAGLADGHDLVTFNGNVQQAIEAKKARMQGTQQAPATKVQTSPVTSPSGDVKAGEITTTTTQR